MTTTDIAALASAWLDGADCGGALHDALEEAGWPLEWASPDAHTYHYLYVQGTGWKLAQLYDRGSADHSQWWGLKGPHGPLSGGGVGMVGGVAATVAEARAAAEAALRQALRGA